MLSSPFTESFAVEAQANSWQGPASPGLGSKFATRPVASSIRTIKRKPAPRIPSELLTDSRPISNEQSGLIASPRVLQEKSLNAANPPGTDAAASAPSQQHPQKQYILDIDAPADKNVASTSADASVQELLRSASLAANSAGARSRKGPLRWMQDKDEHTPAAGAPAQPHQPTLSRKTSISAQLKLGLRRNKPEPQAAALVISAPTDFVHLSTGSRDTNVNGSNSSLRRASTTSAASGRSSFRSSVASISTASSISDATPTATVHNLDDKALYAVAQNKNPLRPLKSIRRPSKLTLREASLPEIPAMTSPKDKRKAIYAAPGSVPAILEPINDDANRAKAGAIEMPKTSPAGASFAAALDRTLDRAHRLEAESPEPELSRSPSSGYDSSACTSNRSSLASLHQFSSFLDFPDLPRSRANSNASSKRDDLWSALTPTSALTSI